MSRGLRALGWLGVLALGGFSIFGRELPQSRAGESLTRRLWGPFAGLAAQAQWVRVHGAMLADREDLVFQRSETAFDLDPGATEGWLFLARHLFYDRASQAREADPVRRAAWMRAAVAVAERGQATAREPGDLALWLGLARVRMATDEHLAWPDGDAGRRDLLLLAAEDFTRAAQAGDPDGAELAGSARRLAQALP